MHKHELAFQLSPHITNLNLNEPPLQIHQQAMTLHPPPPQPQPNPLLYPTTPSDTYTPAGNNFTPSLKAPPPSPMRTHSYPFLPQPHQLHSTHLIKRGRTGRRRNGGGSLYQDDFLRWLSSAPKLSQALFLCLLCYCPLRLSVCLLPATLIRIVSQICFLCCRIYV